MCNGEGGGGGSREPEQMGSLTFKTAGQQPTSEICLKERGRGIG